MSIRNQLNAPTPQGLSLQGQQGPNFENETQRTTSEIQALVIPPPPPIILAAFGAATT